MPWRRLTQICTLAQRNWQEARERVVGNVQADCTQYQQRKAILNCKNKLTHIDYSEGQ